MRSDRVYKTNGRLTADEVVSLALKGLGTRKIAEINGVTRSAVCSMLRRRGIGRLGSSQLLKKGARIKGQLTSDEIIRRYSAGESTRSIAKTDGTTTCLVLRLLRKAKVPIRKTHCKHGIYAEAARIGIGFETYLRIRAIQYLGGICSRCGNTDIRVLQINHIGSKTRVPGSKDYTGILNGTIHDRNVLCANCNIIYEFDRGRRRYPPEILSATRGKAI